MAAEPQAMQDDCAPAPVAGVIEFLEEWLEMAKRGEVQAVAVVAVTEGRELLSGRFENNHWAGAAGRARHVAAQHADGSLQRRPPRVAHDSEK